eukprot:6964295-Prymnesium_polylepis.1
MRGRLWNFSTNRYTLWEHDPGTSELPAGLTEHYLPVHTSNKGSSRTLNSLQMVGGGTDVGGS